MLVWSLGILFDIVDTQNLHPKYGGNAIYTTSPLIVRPAMLVVNRRLCAPPLHDSNRTHLLQQQVQTVNVRKNIRLANYNPANTPK